MLNDPIAGGADKRNALNAKQADAAAELPKLVVVHTAVAASSKSPGGGAAYGSPMMY